MVADDPVASCWLCSAQNLVPTSGVQAWVIGMVLKIVYSLKLPNSVCSWTCIWFLSVVAAKVPQLYTSFKSNYSLWRPSCQSVSSSSDKLKFKLAKGIFEKSDASIQQIISWNPYRHKSEYNFLVPVRGESVQKLHSARELQAAARFMGAFTGQKDFATQRKIITIVLCSPKVQVQYIFPMKKRRKWSNFYR